MGEYDWWIEFFKVLLAYVVLVFVYPTILFRNYLRGKGVTFWFGFCVTGSLVLISTVVIALGIVHLLNAWVVRILFYGSLIWSIARSTRMPITARYLVYKVQNRTYGGKLLVVRFRDALVRTLRRALEGFWRVVRKNALELTVLLVLVAYGVLYFSWNPIHTHGYGFSDIIVHHQWTYGLQQGKVFSAGIYPEAMHCVAYAVSTLFGIELYNVLLYLQCANIIAFLGSIYLFGREVAGWKGSALVMLAAFLTVKLDTITEVYIMSRLQTSLPQEYGLYTVFLIPTFLMRYLKNAGQIKFRGKKTRFYWDRNLVIFTLGIAASVSIHFYDTIMALFSCMGVIVVWLFKIIHWRRLVPLALSALFAVELSFGPMMLAYASGIQFQGSIFWALNVMKDTGEDAENGTEEETQDATSVTEPQVQIQQPEDDAPSQEMVPTAPVEDANQPRENLTQSISRVWRSAVRLVKRVADGIYYGSYKSLYAEEWVNLFLLISKCALALAVGYRLLMALLRRLLPKMCPYMELFDGYAIVVVITLVFMMAFSPGQTGFPKLIAADRVCAAGHGFLMCLVALPVDLAGILLSTFLGRKIMSVLSAAAVAAVFYLVISNGYYHGYLFICATRWDAAVDVSNSIIKDIPDGQFTIISTTDEMFQVIEHGYHEEILTFLNGCTQQEYYLPTRYVFFYVEKRPILYCHYHFNDGPEWLAQQIHSKLYGFASVGDQVTCGEISDEIAEKELILGSKLSDAYTSLYNREIVESRMAIYLRELEKDYPNELNVYYEDEYFICYCLEQNPDRLFNFGLRGD